MKRPSRLVLVGTAAVMAAACARVLGIEGFTDDDGDTGTTPTAVTDGDDIVLVGDFDTQ